MKTETCNIVEVGGKYTREQLEAADWSFAYSKLWEEYYCHVSSGDRILVYLPLEELVKRID